MMYCVLSFVTLVALPASCEVVVVVEPSLSFELSGLLVGGGIEDVNNELYGGLYSQMIYGESFEEPPSNGVSGAAYEAPTIGSTSPGMSRWTWKHWSSTGHFATSQDAFQGKQSQFLSNSAIANFGLGQQGMHFLAGHAYEVSMYVKAQRTTSLTVQLVTDGDGVRDVLADVKTYVTSSSEWIRLQFSLVPKANTTCSMASGDGPNAQRIGRCGYFGTPLPEIDDDKQTPSRNFKTCWQCSGGFVIEAQGAILVDLVLLEPGHWGRYKGLPVRKDVADAMFDMAGWQAIRLGGSFVLARDYSWKRFRGFPRPSYTGFWHPFPSASFGIFETLALCEAADVACAITLNDNESVGDMADFVEYCFGDTNTTWGSQRASDGHPAPYKPFFIEIGNEHLLNDEFVRHVQTIAKAMVEKATELKLPFQLRVVVGQNLDLGNYNATTGALNLTRQLLDALEPFEGAWDAHIGGDAFSDSDDFSQILHESKKMFGQRNSAKLVVFEENGFTHNLQRALVHARMNIASSYFGGFFLIDTAANGLQVFGQNDNGWDQGQIFITPDKVWLSPFGWSSSMLSKHAKDFDIPVKVTNVTSQGVDVGAYKSRDEGIGLRIVNWKKDRVDFIARISWKLSSPPSLETYELRAESPTDVNPPDEPLKVSPRKVTRGKVEISGDVVVVTFPLAPYSFVTMAVRPQLDGVLLII